METFIAFLLYLPLALLFAVALLEFAGAWQNSNRHDASSALLLWLSVFALLPALVIAWLVEPATAAGIPNPFASPAVTGVLVVLALSALGLKAYCRANGITPKPSKHRRNARLKGKARRQQMIPGSFRGILALTCLAAGVSMFMFSAPFESVASKIAGGAPEGDKRPAAGTDGNIQSPETKIASNATPPEGVKIDEPETVSPPLVAAVEPTAEDARVAMAPLVETPVTKIETAEPVPPEPVAVASAPPAGEGTMTSPIEGSPFDDMPTPMGADNTDMTADAGNMDMQGETMEPVSDPAPTTEPAPVETPTTSSPPAFASNSDIYKKIIAPLFQNRCNDCHGDEKQKGGLRLDTPEWIRKGGDSGPVLIAGNPDKSYIYEVVVLPEDDPDIMPPKGKPLSDSQQRYIKQWILEGAPLNDGKQWPGAGGTPLVANGGGFAEDEMADGVASPNAVLIQKLNDEGIIVRPLSSNGAMLEIDYSHASRAAGDLRLDELAPLAENIHTLDLKKTKVADEDLKVVERMTNIRKINLALTDIGDRGLVSVRGLEHIEYLNLYGTRVSDSSVSDLSKMKTLTKLFLWNSRVTDDGYGKLKRALPKTDISFGL